MSKEKELQDIINKHYKTFEVYVDVFFTSFIEALIISAIVYTLSLNYDIQYLSEDKLLPFIVFSYLLIALFKYSKYLIFKHKEQKISEKEKKEPITEEITENKEITDER